MQAILFKLTSAKQVPLEVETGILSRPDVCLNDKRKEEEKEEEEGRRKKRRKKEEEDRKSMKVSL